MTGQMKTNVNRILNDEKRKEGEAIFEKCHGTQCRTWTLSRTYQPQRWEKCIPTLTSTRRVNQP